MNNSNQLTTDQVLNILRNWRRNIRKTYKPVSYRKKPDRPNAFVTLVMFGDNYVYGALVLAHSLRKTNTTAKLVCLYTNDVSPNGKLALEQLFDELILVEYISATNINYGFTKDNPVYAKWIHQSFTKFNCIGLIQYRKICFLDADMIPVKNIDHLFEHKTFTCIYSSIRDNLNGGKIDYQTKKRYLNRHPVRGSIFILEPSLNDFNRIKMLLDIFDRFKNFQTQAGPDELILTLYYWKKLRAIHRGYSATYKTLSNYKEFNIPDIYIIDFIGTKPWNKYQPDYTEYALYYKLYDEILNKYQHIPKLNFN